MDWTAKLDALADDERELITKISKTWLAKGESPSVVAECVKRWLAKNGIDGGGEGSKPPRDQRDPTEQLEKLVDASVTKRGIKRSMAYGYVLRTRPDINAALAQQRDAKLRKAAHAHSSVSLPI